MAGSSPVPVEPSQCLCMALQCQEVRALENSWALLPKSLWQGKRAHNVLRLWLLHCDRGGKQMEGVLGDVL